MTRATILAAAVLLGCGEPSTVLDDATLLDAALLDAAVLDAAADGALDAASVDAAMSDAELLDADAAIDDAAVHDASADDALVPPGDSGACSCDDGIACTDDVCTSSGCTHAVRHERCVPTGYCSATLDCVGAGICGSGADCVSTTPCIVSRCDAASASCQYTPLDNDGDGESPLVCGGTDCDDSRGTTSAHGTETCDGRDNDCDSSLDEGDLCSDGFSCSAGTCGCAGALCTRFGTTVCADLTRDPGHCGSCVIACPDGASCVDSACACPVATPDVCGGGFDSGRCVDLQSDADSCGACDHRCDDGTCTGGVCTCAAGLTLCPAGTTADECIDTSTAESDCGACGYRCPAGATCSAGHCSMESPWVAGFGTSTREPTVDDLSVGPAGDIYVLTGAEGGGRDVVSGRTLFTGTSGFVHVTPDGVIDWGRAAPSGRLTATADGVVYATQWATGASVTVGGATLACASTSRCVGLWGLGTDGSSRWTRIVNSPSGSYVPSIERSGSLVVVVGSIVGSVDFGGGALAGDSATSGFVVGYDDADGSYAFGFRVPGAPNQVRAFDDGTLVVIAEYNGTPVVGGVTLPSSTGNSRRYIARFTTSGAASAVVSIPNVALATHRIAAGPSRMAVTGNAPTSLRWYDASGATSVYAGPSELRVRDVDALPVDDWILTGRGPVTLGTTSIGTDYTYIARLSDSGVLEEAVSFYGRDNPLVRAFDEDEVIVAVGGSQLAIGPGSLALGVSAQATFVARVRVR